MRHAARFRRQALLVGSLVALLLVITPGVAGAATSRSDDDRVSVTGPIVVGPTQRVDGAVVSVDGPVTIAGVVDGDVLSIHGSVTVTGRVTGTVTVVSGDARISGRVGDHVTVLRGRAIVSGDAVVRGDVRSSERPEVAPTASVTGDVEKTDFSAWFTAAGWVALFLWWIAVTITMLIVGILFILLLPGAAAASLDVGRRDIGMSVLWGALLAIVLPVVAAALGFTLVGLPLALGLMLALALAFPLGYVVASLVLGRLLAKTVHPVVAFLIGFAILRVIALIPGLGMLVGFLAAAYGLGALAVAGWRAARQRSAAPGSPGSPEPQDRGPVPGGEPARTPTSTQAETSA